MGPRLAFACSIVLFVALVCATVRGDSRQASPPPPFVVIVNPDVQVGTLDRGFVEDVFLKKVTTWPGGATVRPVDLPPDSPVRSAFTRAILNRSVEAVKGYWQQRIFSGRDVPPPELESEAEVVRYVATHDGAIGYVAGATPRGGCRAVGVE